MTTLKLDMKHICKKGKKELFGCGQGVRNQELCTVRRRGGQLGAQSFSEDGIQM